MLKQFGFNFILLTASGRDNFFYLHNIKLIEDNQGIKPDCKTGGSMFAINKSWMEVFVRAALIAAILFNALALKHSSCSSQARINFRGKS